MMTESNTAESETVAFDTGSVQNRRFAIDPSLESLIKRLKQF